MLHTTRSGMPAMLSGMVFSVLFVMLLSGVVIPTDIAHGHGFGIDTTPPITIQNREITISVELPEYFDMPGSKQLTVTATDEETGNTARNVTYLLGISRADDVIFREHFFAPDGILRIDTVYAQGGIKFSGVQDGPFDAWYSDGLAPLEVTGPIFETGGLYTFDIAIKTIDELENVVNTDTYLADLTLVDVEEFIEQDSEENDVKFGLRSYFDSATRFEYDPEKKQVTFEIPFDWSEKRMSHVPVVHEEVRFPKDFAEFLYPSYVGSANGVELFKASVQIDDYTIDDERLVHFILLQDHLRLIKNQQKSDEPLPDSIIFVLSASDEVKFPLTAFTRGEDFQVDLSWDPVEIEPGQKTNFVFTIRNGATGEPMRNSEYTFVILQNDREIHRVSGLAQVGGDFEPYEFAEDQTGPTVIRFENIRNTGLETEFGFMVIPEFGGIVAFVLAAGVGAAALGSRYGLLRGSGL
ncbi:MAG: peptidase [Thaumarchaeota archaeon]|nr:peptidase [Nitrososphaerota archaeon]